MRMTSALWFVACLGLGTAQAATFSVTLAPEHAREPLNGRLLLLLSVDPSKEPRFLIDVGTKSQQVFGIDVSGWKGGAPQVFDSKVLGYPRLSLADVPAGTYRVQALLHRYETFRRKDGHVVQLPMDRGEGQVWNLAPGNLYSTVREIKVDPAVQTPIALVLDQIIPPIKPPADTEWVKHERIQSRLLTEFWGRPMYLGAHVLLPKGWAEHPKARYPLMINHGHFPADFDGFRHRASGSEARTRLQRALPSLRLQPAAAGARSPALQGLDQPGISARARDRDSTRQSVLRRFVRRQLREPRPVCGCNSAGADSLSGTQVPRARRGLVAIRLRRLDGRVGSAGSSGEVPGLLQRCVRGLSRSRSTFALMARVNIYEDRNAYVVDAPFKQTPRIAMRDHLGRPTATLEEVNRLEWVLGPNSRSGGQWDIWQAVFSPVGADGYPQPIWNKRTGEIDRAVASYWRENYDLVHIMQRDWEKGLGEKLRGKIHLYVGELDNYYLERAVYLAQEFLESTRNPGFEGVIDYGRRAEHCWNGDHTRPNSESRLRYHQMFIPLAVERMRKTAPAGADLDSWNY